MSALPLDPPRRACRPRGARASSISPFEARLAQPNVRFRDIVVDVSPLRATSAIRRPPGCSRSFPARLRRPRRLYGPRRPPRRDPAGADRRSLSRAEQRRDRRVGRLAGHDQRHALREGPAWRDRRQRAHPGDHFYHPIAVDQPMRVESNHWRVVALAQAFAGWAPGSSDSSVGICRGVALARRGFDAACSRGRGMPFGAADPPRGGSEI